MVDRQVNIKVVKIDMSFATFLETMARTDDSMYNGTQMTQVSRAGNKNGTEESRHKKKKLNKKANMSCIWHMAGGCEE
jgi:hypothetical protein